MTNQKENEKKYVKFITEKYDWALELCFLHEKWYFGGQRGMWHGAIVNYSIHFVFVLMKRKIF